MAKRKARDRYKQLSDAQRLLVSGQGFPSIGLSAAIPSFAGKKEELPLFEAALERLRVAVAGWASRDAILYGFVVYVNADDAANKLRFKNFCDVLLGGLVEYVKARSLEASPVHAFNGDMFAAMRAWLLITPNKGKSEPRSRAYAARQLSRAFDLIKLIRASAKFGPVDSWPLEKPAPISRRGGNKTQTLDDVLWYRIYEAAKSEALDVIKTCTEAWAVLAGPPVPPEKWGDKDRYASFESMLWGIQKRYKGVVPTLKQMKLDSPAIARAVQYHWGVETSTMAFQPCPRTMLPLLLLLMVYSSANPSPLKGLKTKNIKYVAGIGSARIAFHFLKGRGEDYDRSFAIDGRDPLSPDELVKFVRQWTSRIRNLAGVYSRYLLIFVNKDSDIGPFSASNMPGRKTDNCPAFDSALTSFQKDWGLPKFTSRQLRKTSLSLIREIFNDDALAVKYAAGHTSIRTGDVHYRGSSDDLRDAEGLSEVMSTMPRYILTRGRVSARGTAKDADVLAATPGWKCADPFSSPMPGQEGGKLCSAYGQCPACPLANIDLFSPNSCARAVQLKLKLGDAIEKMDFQRWLVLYKPALDKLETLWLPSFSDAVFEEASKLSLSELADLE